jgi:predicted site-specific integrase-resolvase
MKLSDYAKLKGVHYLTAYRWWKDGRLNGQQMGTGTIIVENDALPKRSDGIITYSRVSSSENKNNLETQNQRLADYCAAKGYRIVSQVLEIGSGVNDNRKKLNALFEREDYNRIIVEHKDRLTRFGFNYIKTLLEKLGVTIEVINESNGDKEDLMQDFVSIITSFCARIYGLRRTKRQTEKLIEVISNDKN